MTARTVEKHKLDYKVVIPARYASTRLPGKPLIQIAGKPMLQHTYERALMSQANEVIIATDDERIVAAASKFTADIVMTSAEHKSGTERLAEVVKIKSWHDDAIIVNVQGDEPLVLPEHINQLAVALEQYNKAGLATMATELTEVASLWDPNIVKVVLDQQGYALYFSRAVIPWDRDNFAADSGCDNDRLPAAGNWYRHIGMYAYRAATLKRYSEMMPCKLETTESLEQLRLLYNGIPIHVTVVAEQPGHGVDVIADIAIVETLLKQPK